MKFVELTVEDAALSWFKTIRWFTQHGPDIAPGTPAAERGDYYQVILQQWLLDGLTRLNPTLPVETLDDAFRKLTRPEGPNLVFRNRAIHRMLVYWVNVELKRKDGSVGSAQVDALLSKLIPGELLVKGGEHFFGEAL